MKRRFFIPAALLSMAIMFTGCGDSKSDSSSGGGSSSSESSGNVAVPSNFSKYLPADADGVGYIDGEKIDSSMESILKMLLEDEKIDINIFKNKYYLAGSSKDKSLTVYMQSKDGNAKKVFAFLAEQNIFKEISSNELKDSGITIKMIDDDSLICVIAENALPIAEKDSKGSSSSLFSKLHDNKLVSLYAKSTIFRLIPDFSDLEKILPEIVQLDSMAMNISSGSGKMEYDIKFKNTSAANSFCNKANAFINNEIRKEDPKFADALTVILSGNSVKVVSDKGIFIMVENALNTSRLRAREACSINNMKQIGLCIITYQGDYGKMPETFNNLSLYLGGNNDVFIAPFDKKSVKVQNNGAKLNPWNTSYAYFGKGLDISVDANAPIMIVKPWLLPKGARMQVLYADGSVRPFYQIQGPCSMSCREVVEMICKESSVSSKVKEILLRNADAEDYAR